MEEHVVMPGETLWEISQIYGIRLHSLKAKNRIYKDADLKQGMILKLHEYRKRNEDISYAPSRPLQTANTQRPVDVPREVQSSSSTGPSVPKNEPHVARTQQSLKHTVQAGETLYAISRQYQVTVDELRRWNNLNSESILSIGQLIVIKK